MSRPGDVSSHLAVVAAPGSAVLERCGAGMTVRWSPSPIDTATRDTIAGEVSCERCPLAQPPLCRPSHVPQSDRQRPWAGATRCCGRAVEVPWRCCGGAVATVTTSISRREHATSHAGHTPGIRRAHARSVILAISAKSGGRIIDPLTRENARLLSHEWRTAEPVRPPSRPLGGEREVCLASIDRPSPTTRCRAQWSSPTDCRCHVFAA